MRQLRWILTLTMCALLTSAVQMHAQPQYSVTDLGTLVPYGVNSQAMVVGEMVLNGQWGPTLWQAGQFTALTSPGGGGQALGVNDTGEIVGWTSNGQGSGQGAYWYQETLILLDGALPSTARAINAGHMLAGDRPSRGDTTPPDGCPMAPMTRCSQHWGGGLSFGNAIEPQGRVCGRSQAPFMTHAVCWERDGRLTDWGTLGGNFATFTGANGEVAVAMGARSKGCGRS